MDDRHIQLLYLLLLLVTVWFGLKNRRIAGNTALRYAVIWLAFFVALAYGYQWYMGNQ